MLRKFARFRVVTRKHEEEPACALAKKAEENQKRTSLFRYKDSPEEIQGEALVSSRGQEDLDTNRGVAGRKTERGWLPRQGRGQREYSHHA